MNPRRPIVVAFPVATACIVPKTYSTF